MSIDFKNLNAMSSKFTTNDKDGVLFVSEEFNIIYQKEYYLTQTLYLLAYSVQNHYIS